MRPHAVRYPARLLIAAAAVFAVLAGSNLSASAGGWAVGTLDSMPAATAGETTQVGFTILQHGVTPAELDDVGIEIQRSNGVSEYFPAASSGTPGHYLAAVTFPEESGSYSWAIHMGWFGVHDLGTLTVNKPASTTTSTVRWGMYTLAVIAGIAIALTARRMTGRSERFESVDSAVEFATEQKQSIEP